MRAWIALLGLAVGGLLCWTVPVDLGEGRLLGMDAYYHLRHMQYARDHFPALLRRDHATHYPQGQRAETPGLFDLTVAAAALPFPDHLPAVAAWAAPVLGALSLVALFLLGRRVMGAGAGLLAALFLVLCPGDFRGRVLLGFADHHAAEVLLALLATGGLVRSLGAPSWRPAFAGALPLALLLFTWTGAPLYLLVCAGALSLLAVVRLWTGGPSLAPVCFRYGAALLVLTAVPSLLFPDLVMIPRVWPYVLAGAAALAALAPVLLAAHASGRPRLAAAGLVLLAAGGAFAATRLEGALLDRLLLPKTELVVEHLAFEPKRLLAAHGAVLLLALGGPMVAVARVRRDGGRAFLAAAVATMVVLLWWGTRDYAYAGAAFLALLAALAAGALVRRLGPRVLAPLALALLLPLWPLQWMRPPWPTAAQRERLVLCDDAWADAMAWLARGTPEPSLAVDAAVDPWNGDFAYPDGTYGVWAAWDYGNLVNALGRRAVTWSQGLGRHAARFLLARDEEESLRALDAGCGGTERVRYVVLDARTLGERWLAHFRAGGGDLAAIDARADAGFGEAFDATVAARLYLRDGDGLGRYRLVYASPQASWVTYLVRRARGEATVQRQSFPLGTPDDRRWSETLARRPGVTEVEGLGRVYGGVVEPAVKIFERVEGARLHGRTRPGALVRARLALRSSGGRPHRYARETRADAEGRYGFTVPYATAPGPTDVRAQGPLVLEAAEGPGAAPFARREVAIAEEAVQSGAALAQDLRPAGADEGD